MGDRFAFLGGWLLRRLAAWLEIETAYDREHARAGSHAKRTYPPTSAQRGLARDLGDTPEIGARCQK
jgi:hypothetical protein